MDDDADQQHLTAAPGYAQGQLAKAFATALTHEDADTRRRAEDRVRRWRAVLAGMAGGLLSIGSRTPVAGLPDWVTPEVVHGGFATGTPSAGGPLQPYETRLAERFGVPADRRALFAHCLTDSGLTWLWGQLNSGRYEVTVPEEGALLTMAWLVRHGETAAALDLIAELEPFADQLRFLPRPSTGRPASDVTDALHRRTVSDTVDQLVRRRPNAAVETQREALAVWQPFGDELLTHWLETVGGEGGRVLELAPDADWLERGAGLLSRYRQLAEEHTHCGKHRNPKQNLGILRGALEETVAGRPLDARRLGLLRHAVASMVRRRGLPGSAPHAELRRVQRAQAALPSHHALAQVLVGRLAGLPQESGIADLAPVLAPVSEPEQRATGLPAGAQLPPVLRRVVEGALSAPVSTLVERGVVPSAEVLAELVPQLVAVATARSYDDPALRTLMAANYRAFRTRRSLLLLNLERQVRIEELPWVRAVAPQRGDGSAEAALLLRQLGELAVRGFPGTILPNPLVRELGVLARQSKLGAPLVEELAADIFMDAFGPKFLVAAGLAGELLGGSLYERYYGIDYAAIRDLAIAEASESAGRGRADRTGPRTSPGFARLCAERAAAASSAPDRSTPDSPSGSPSDSTSDSPSGSRVAANGKVIEQSQILTTHNLATLVHRVGIAPEPGWADLARRCFDTVCRLTARVHRTPWSYPTIKDAAYAWRQLVFHLSLCPPAEQRRVLDELDAEAARHPAHVTARLAPALAGLRLVVDGGTFAPDGTADEGRARRLLGWTTDGHWLATDPTAVEVKGS
ncbi:hypothetical protein [Streptomyces sp. NPDC088196]|uniref:hypothetical protein n=1 Tax=Streptomyces sp. NPDC088196 TaxID=3154868 RepID=UPI00345077C0